MVAAAQIAAHGLQARLAPRWEARIYRRDESANPVLHLANFALPPGRGDFGTGAVELMSSPHVFMSLFEFDREEVGRPLFAARGVPRPQPREFAANALQRRISGQAGWQRFFTENDRAFSLYVVLGSHRHVHDRIGEIHETLDGLEIGVR